MAVAYAEVERGQSKIIDFDRSADRFPEWIHGREELQNPTLRCVPARVFLEEVNRKNKTSYTLANLPEQHWDELLKDGDVQSLYIMGIYKPSPAAQADSIRYLPQYRKRLEDPDLTENDVVASPFAIIEDNPSTKIAANWEEWESLMDRLHARGVEVLIDYIPNHVALDHPWIEEHPEYLIEVSAEKAKENPQDYYFYTDTSGNSHYYACGKHTEATGFVDVWTDTLQLNYANPELRKAMIDRLLKLRSHKVDGFRVDTAVLPAYERFKTTWGDIIPDMGEPWDFWGDAIRAAKQAAEAVGEHCTFIGETYEHAQVLESFDYVYGASLYGRLVDASKDESLIGSVKQEIAEVYSHRERYPRNFFFTTNHDVARPESRFNNRRKALACATITAFMPGIWMMMEGEERGKSRNHPMQVIKPYDEKVIEEVQASYTDLIELRQKHVIQEGVPSLQNTGDSPIIALEWSSESEGMIVCTNLSEGSRECKIVVPPGVTKDDVMVYDPETGRALSPSIISDPAIDNTMYIGLEGSGRQIVFWQVPEADSKVA